MAIWPFAIWQFAPPAAAQPPDSTTVSDKTSLFVSFGHGHSGPARTSPDAWLPVTLYIQGGAKPFEGVVRIEYQQDSTQSALVVNPVAATPGKTTETRVALALPAVCSRIEFALVDRRGSVQQRLVYSQTPTRNEIKLPMLSTPGEFAALAIGSAGGPASSISLMSASQTAHNGPAAHTAIISPDELPTTWAGLDSTAVLIVDAEAAPHIDPRAMAAIHEWVSAGGRLVILAPRAGTDWREWLPPAPFGAVVSLDDPVSGPVPAELADAVRATPKSPMSVLDNFAAEQPQPYTPPGYAGPVPSARKRADPSAKPAESDAKPSKPAEIPVEPATTLSQRLIHLTPQGELLGWRVHWRAESTSTDLATAEPPDAAARTGMTGLLAEGPIGFGWVAIVGVDPRKPSAVASSRATLAVWESILAPVLPSIAAATPNVRGGPYYYANGTLADAANNIALNHLSNVPTVGHGAFAAISAAMVALALLIGPVDAIVLRRLRLRHRSWLTALVWITLASLAAYEAPLLGRDSRSVLNRVSIIDAIIPPGASVGRAIEVPAAGTSMLPPMTLGDDAAAPLAWQTSYTGIFAGATITAAFSGDRLGASWWRGVSAVQYYGQEQRLTSGAIPTLQTSPDLAGIGASNDPWGGWGLSPRTAAAAGGNAILPTSLSLWTFRTFQDRVRTVPPCNVRIESADAGRQVVLTNLPPGAQVRAGVCVVGHRWYTLPFPSPATAQATGELRAGLDGPGAETAPPMWQQSIPTETNGYRYYADAASASLESRPMILFAAPGPAGRTPAIDALLAAGGGGRWACVYLLIDHMPPDITIQSPATCSRTVVCRFLVPAPPPGDAK